MSTLKENYNEAKKKYEILYMKLKRAQLALTMAKYELDIAILKSETIITKKEV